MTIELEETREIDLKSESPLLQIDPARNLIILNDEEECIGEDIEVDSITKSNTKQNANIPPCIVQTQSLQPKLNGQGTIVTLVGDKEIPLWTHQVLEGLQILKNGYNASVLGPASEYRCTYETNVRGLQNTTMSRQAFNNGSNHTSLSEFKSYPNLNRNSRNMNRKNAPVYGYHNTSRQLAIDISPMSYQRVRGSNYRMHQPQFRYAPYSRNRLSPPKSNHSVLIQPPKLNALPSADSYSSYDTCSISTNSHHSPHSHVQCHTRFPSAVSNNGYAKQDNMMQDIERERQISLSNGIYQPISLCDYKIDSFEGESMFKEFPCNVNRVNHIQNSIQLQNSDVFPYY